MSFGCLGQRLCWIAVEGGWDDGEVCLVVVVVVVVVVVIVVVCRVRPFAEVREFGGFFLWFAS